MKEEVNDEDLIKDAIIGDDFEEEPIKIEDFIEWQTSFIFGIFEILIAMAEKMGIDSKEVLKHNHPNYEENLETDESE